MDRRTASMRVVLGVALVTLFAASPAIARTPVGEWRFDEGSALVAHDSSGSGLDGALRAGTNAPTWIAGLQGSALHFDGDDEVALPDRAALEPAKITVAAWVRSTGSPGTYRYVLSKGSRSCWSSSYGLYTGESGGAAFYTSGAGAFTVSPQAAPSQVWDGRWHRLTGSYDGTRVRLYLDGAEVGSGTPNSDPISYGIASRAPYIGTYHGDCDLPYVGDIDALRVWNDARSAAAVAQDAVVPPTAKQPAGPVTPVVPIVAKPGK